MYTHGALDFRILFDTTLASGNICAFDASMNASSSSSSSSSTETGVRARRVAPAPPDDVMIFIRKHLTGANPKFRHVAIAGAVAYLTQTAHLTSWLATTRQEAQIEMASYNDMLALLFNKSSERGEDFSFLMQELCFALEKGCFSAPEPHFK